MVNFDDLFWEAAKPLTYLREATLKSFSDKIYREFKSSKSGIYQFEYFNLFTEYGIPYDNFGKVLERDLTVIKANDFINIREVLIGYDLEDHISEITSIIRSYYCAKLLVEIDSEYIEDNKDFDYEFYNLFICLEKNIGEIQIKTRRKNDTAIIKNKSLINLIRVAFAENILKLNYAQEIIDIAEQEGNIKYEIPLEKIKQGAAINLLIYLQIQTDFKYNASKENILKKKFSNKQLELIFYLLEAGRIVDENVSSEPKDYTRNHIKRTLDKNAHLLQLLINPNNYGENTSTNLVKWKLDENESRVLFERVDERKRKVKSRIDALTNVN